MISTTCVVFGGSSGIGESTAKKLAANGLRVIITGRDQGRLEKARDRIGLKVEIASVDATDRSAVDKFFEQLGGFEHLVLSLSGGKGAGPFRTLNLNDIRTGMEGKFFAQISVAQSALNYLKPDGSITFVSAGSARVALPGTIGLAAINGAIETIIPTLAKELAPLRVNAVSPGVIDTPWWDKMPKEVKNSIFEQTSKCLPVRRVGHAEDVSQAISFLIENTFTTGTIIEVDGGAHLG